MQRNLHALTGALLALTLGQPAVAADEYIFDQSHTEIRISWDHLGFSTTSAYFREFDGVVRLDEDSMESSSVDVHIDPASIESGYEPFNEHLRSDDFFDIANHPDARFVSREVRVTGEDNGYRVLGDLALHGITRPVELDVTINRIDPHPVTNVRTLGFDATATVLRSEFDLGRGTPFVGDEVAIRISAEMMRRADLDD